MATVTAVVDTGTDRCSISLYDNGLEPDLLAEDGIYSVYISPECLSVGRVSIKVLAVGTVGVTKLVPVVESPRVVFDAKAHEYSKPKILDSAFQRVAIVQELFIEKMKQADVDVIPPARVADLRYLDDAEDDPDTKEINPDYFIRLSWTAVGDDRTFGNASDYEIRVSESFQFLLNDFDNDAGPALNITNVTLSYQNDRVFAIVELKRRLSHINTTYVAIRAVDDVGNYGPVSNIIAINIQTVVPEGETTIEGIDIALIVGVSVSAAAVVCIIAIALYFYKKSKTVYEVRRRSFSNSGFADSIDSVPESKLGASRYFNNGPGSFSSGIITIDMNDDTVNNTGSN